MKDEKILKDFKETGTLHTRSKKTAPDSLHQRLEKLPLTEKVAAFKYLRDSIEANRKALDEQLSLIHESNSTH